MKYLHSSFHLITFVLLLQYTIVKITWPKLEGRSEMIYLFKNAAAIHSNVSNIYFVFYTQHITQQLGHNRSHSTNYNCLNNYMYSTWIFTTNSNCLFAFTVFYRFYHNHSLNFHCLAENIIHSFKKLRDFFLRVFEYELLK